LKKVGAPLICSFKWLRFYKVDSEFFTLRFHKIDFITFILKVQEILNFKFLLSLSIQWKKLIFLIKIDF
jgi:hypothetical protein